MEFLFRKWFLLFIFVFFVSVFTFSISPAPALAVEGILKFEDGFLGEYQLGTDYYIDPITIPVDGETAVLLQPEHSIIILTFNPALSFQIQLGDGEPFQDVASGEWIYFNMPINITTRPKQAEFNAVFFDYDMTIYSQASVSKNAYLTPPTEPFRDGYIFQGWRLQGQEEYFDFNTPIIEDTALYAHYVRLYNISFYNGEDLIKTIQVPENSLASPQDAPQKEGYSFLYWQGDQGEFDFDTPIIEDTELYACYEIQLFRVEFYLNNELWESQTVAYMQTAEEIEIECEYYIITPFRLKDSNEEYSFPTPITQDIKLYAQKIENFYTITFIDNEVITTQKVEKGCPICSFPPHQRQEDTFIGWQKEKENFNTSKDYVPNENLTLYAIYEEDLFTVIFNLDGGSGEGELVQKVKSGFEATPPVNIQKDGHAFLGWEGEFENIQSDTQIIARYSINTYIINFYLYGEMVYQIIDIPYSATLDSIPEISGIKDGDELLGWKNAEGGEFDITAPITQNLDLYGVVDKIDLKVYFHFKETTFFQTVKYGETAIPPDPPQPDQGYDFAGWYIDEVTPFIFSTPITEELHLYGKQSLKIFEVVFCYVIEEQTYQKTQNVEFGQKVQAQVEEIGYSFEWFEDEFFTEPFDFNKAIVSDTIIYGLATPNVYTITIVYPDYIDRELEVFERYYKQELNLPSMEIYGYELLGHGEDFEFMPAYDIVLYPQFQKKVFTLVFGDVYQVQAEYLKEITLPDFEPPQGYCFDGWRDELGAFFPKEQPYLVQGNMTFEEKLTEIREIIISYLNYSEVYNYGDVVDISSPQKDGHIFIGWYADEELTKPFGGKAVSEEYEIHLYPKWAKEYYTLSVFGEERTFVIAYGETSPAVSPMAKEGHTFEGWFLDEEGTNPYQEVLMDRDITIYPKYQIMSFSVVFLGIERTICCQSVNYGESAQYPDYRDIMEEGYKFLGFDKAFDNISCDLTITAEYAPLYANIFYDDNGQEISPFSPPQKEGYVFVGWETVYEDNLCLHYPVYLALPKEENQPQKDSDNQEDAESQEETDKETIVGRIIINDQKPPSAIDSPAKKSFSDKIASVFTIAFILALSTFCLYLNIKLRKNNLI